MNQPASDISTNQAVATDTPLRFVTAASLFDGHDAAINIMRRLIQAQGCEVIHLGHNRSVLDIVNAAIQEDADAIALSSYQGGHNEYFRFMIDQLKERGAGHIQVFGGDMLDSQAVRQVDILRKFVIIFLAPAHHHEDHHHPGVAGVGGGPRSHPGDPLPGLLVLRAFRGGGFLGRRRPAARPGQLRGTGGAGGPTDGLITARN